MAQEKKTFSSEKIKEIELNLLIEFGDFCRKHNLYYTLAGGTLLGAIRHQGFIPWDDDIDVIMPRKSYNLFIEMWEKNKESSNSLKLLYPGKEEYSYPFAKLCDRKTIAKMTDGTTKHGIWIDIFPLDNIPDKNSINKLFKKARILRAVAISMNTDFKHVKIDYKLIPKLGLKIFSLAIGKKNVLHLIEKNAESFNKNKESHYIGGVVWGYGIGEIMKKSDYLKPVKVAFEGHEFVAPSCWKSYLSGLYGDYMKLPPVKDRKNHSIKAWKLD